MQLDVPPPAVAHAGLRALKTVALADGTLHELEAGLIATVQRLLLGTAHELDALTSITPDELASIVPPGIFRERILRGCVLVALSDGDASLAEERVLGGFADALAIDPAPLTDFRRILADRLKVLRLDVARRSFIGKRIGQHVANKGVRGMVEVALTFQGHEVPSLANRYRSLSTYPKGTLGRSYADFIAKNQFAFPGEAHGAPEPIVFHDCVHVLAGYDTTAEEEVLAAAFQAGFQRYDPFFSLLFVICQFHLGIEISPIAGVETMKMRPETMLAAFVRGTACAVDLSDGWDPWSAFARPVDELRAEYRIAPR